MKDKGYRSFGYIAEDVFEILPQLVPLNNEGLPEGVSYDMLPTLIVAEMKKLKNTVDTQASTISTLQSTITSLLERVSALENK